MPQIRWYLNNTLADGWQLLDQSAATAATCNCGWVVGTGSTFSSELESNVERASTTFVANTVPDGTLDTTLKDAARSQFAWTGDFAAGNWTFQFAVVSTVQSGAADGQIVFRVLKADANGANATEITSAQQAASIVSNVAGTDLNSSATISLPAFSLLNQYLFVQIAWKRTGAGGMTTTNIRLRTGSTTTVGTTGLTGDFTLKVFAATIAPTAVVNSPTVAGGSFLQTVTAAVCATTVALFVPTVVPDQAVTTVLCASTAALYSPAVSGGSVSGVKSIGTASRDYSTAQAWFDACPANLVTAGHSWRGEAYNDSEFTGTLVISGITVDATHYIELTAAAGQSFQDHAGVRTNPLRYDQSKGVGVAADANYSRVVYATVDGVRISRLQVKNIAGNGRALEFASIGQSIADSIFEATRGAGPIFETSGYGGVVNTLIVNKNGSGGGVALGANDTYHACTVVHPSDVSGGGTAFVRSGYGTGRILSSCAVFGFGTLADDPSSTRFDQTNSRNNVTDLASGLPGTTGNQHSVSWSQFTPFTDADKDSQDFRAIAGTALIDAGFQDATLAPLDISKTTRDSTPTPGVWEVTAGGGGDQSVTAGTRAAAAVLNAPAVYPAQDLTTSLMGHWPFTEASGGVADAHGTNPLTLAGADQGQDPIENTPARGLEWTGTAESQFYVTYDTALAFTTDQVFTFVVRVKFESTAAGTFFYVFQRTTSDGNAANMDCVLLWTTGTGFQFGVRNAAGTTTYATAAGDWTSLSDDLGQPFVLACGYDPVADKVWIRVNSETRVEAAQSTGTRTSATTLTLGNAYPANTNNNMDGAMGPVSFWKRTLTDAEIDYWIGVKGDYAKIGGSGAAAQAVTGTTIASTTLLNVPRVNRVQDLTLNLVGHWPFSETGLDTADALDQHGANPLTALGGTGAAAQDPMNGTPARYVEFDNLMAFRHADNAALSPEQGAGQAFTFLIRCKFETNPASLTFWYLFAKDDDTGATFDIYLYYQGNSGFRFRATNVAGSPSTTPGNLQMAVTPGTPYFVAGVFNPALGGSQLALRWGTTPGDMQNAATSFPTPVRDTGTKFTVGGRTSGSGGVTESFDGAIGPATWFKRALSNAEIDHWVEVNGDYAAIGGGGNTQTITAGTIAAATGLNPPTVANAGDTSQAVTLPVLGSTTVLTAPTLTPGPVAVTAGTLASTALLNAPTITVGAVTVTAGTIVSTTQLFAPTVAAGPVAVTTAHRASTLVVTAPTVAPGPATVVGNTLASTLQVFAPSVTVGPVAVTTAHRATTAQLFAPTLTVGAVTITTPAPIAATQLFQPALTAVGAGDIGGASIPTTAQLFAVTVTTGPVTVTGATIAAAGSRFAPSVALTVTTPALASTLVVQAPTVAPGAVTVVTAPSASTLVLTPPSVALTLVTAHRASTLALTAPSVALGPVTITAASIASTAVLTGPLVTSGAVGILAAHRASTAVLFAPQLTLGPVTLVTAHRASTLGLFAPTVVATRLVLAPHRASTLVLYPPSVEAPTLQTIVLGTRPAAALVYPPRVWAPIVLTKSCAVAFPISSDLPPARRRKGPAHG